METSLLVVAVYLFINVLLQEECYGDGRFIPVVDVNECAKKTVCNKVENYPHEYIEELLKKAKNPIKQHLADDTEVHVSEPSHFKDLVRRKRNASEGILLLETDEDYKGETLCEGIKQIITVRAVKTLENKWYFLLRPFMLSYGECKYADAECQIIRTFSLSTQTKCKQKYLEMEMKVLNYKGEQILKYFRLPTFCDCTIYQISEIPNSEHNNFN